MKNSICNQYGKKLVILNRKNLWMNNKVRGDKMQFACIFFHTCCTSADKLKF